MTLEEAQARIAELEAENATLKGNRRPKRKIIPPNVVLKYPFFKKFLYENCINLLSKFVRATIFQPIQKPRGRTYQDGSKIKRLSDYVAQLDELTDTQYQVYCEVVEKIIGIVADYREKDT